MENEKNSGTTFEFSVLLFSCKPSGATASCAHGD
ncbi:unnamed protein product [Victoria cruziana]